MLLRLQRHSFDLVYVPGSRLDVADALSRAPVSQLTVTEQSDLETVCAVVDAQLTDRKIAAVRQATAEDKTLQKVQQLIKKGWRSDKRGLPNQVIPYLHLRDELVYEDGIIFKGDRCVIPQSMRRSTLEELHRPHLRVEATLRRARETVFWPRLSSELRDYVSQCDTYRSFDPEQQKEPLRGRRKSSQKLAKRRTCVWGGGGGEGVSTVFAKQASKKKKKSQLHVNYVRSAPLGPAANRLEVDRAAQGLRCERVRRTSPSNAYKESR